MEKVVAPMRRTPRAFASPRRFFRRTFPSLLRIALSFAYVFTSTIGPALAQETRYARLRPQADEFSMDSFDGAYFSPQRIRERIERQDRLIASHNARFAMLQGRPMGRAPQADPQILVRAMEKFLAAADMSEEVERKRAENSRTLAAAAGFQYKAYTDGRRVWYKGGRAHRVENEKIVDGFGNVSRRDTLDMVYDAKGRLISSKTEVKDPQGHVTTVHWTGSYASEAPQARLAGFSETEWDALGNKTKTERSAIIYDASGERITAYVESVTDSQGRVARRQVSDTRHDDKGRILSFQEKSTDGFGKTSSRLWTALQYKDNPAYTDTGSESPYLISAYREEITAGDLFTVREWTGASYNKQGRLTDYQEETKVNSPGASQTRSRRWSGGRYDGQGRLAGYQEVFTDEQGRRTRVSWEAKGYDDFGRILSYKETTLSPQGKLSWRRWSGGQYNTQNQLIAYTESLSNDEGQSALRTWRQATYEKGHLTGYEEDLEDASGRTARSWREGQYDGQGRLLSYRETKTDQNGTGLETQWTATAFDAMDRVTSYEEVSQGPAGRQVKSWSGAYNALGQVASSKEVVTGADLLSVTHVMASAKYNGQGLLTDSVTTTTRSDEPGLKTSVWVSGRTYDGENQITGGREETHMTGYTRQGALNLWTTKTVQNAVTNDGRLGSYEQVTETRGTDEFGRGVHTQDRLQAVLGQKGDRSDRLRRMAFDGQGAVVLDQTTLTTQSRVIKDLQGRVVSYQEETTDESAPYARSVLARRNFYGVGGDLLKYSETITDAQGQTTHRTVDEFVQDGLGRVTGSRETAAREGTSLVETTRKTRMAYDALGRLVSLNENSESSGPGYFSVSHVARQMAYDAAGRLESTKESGSRNRAAFSSMIMNAAFDKAGRAAVTHEEGYSEDGGPYDLRKSDILYDVFGRRLSFSEQGWSNGEFRERHYQVLQFDRFGREAATLEKGRAAAGAYEQTTRISVFNDLGQAMAKEEKGWTASGGAYERRQSNILYDAQGRLAFYEQRTASTGRTSESQWQSLGYNAKGQSMGHRETGRARSDDQEAFDFLNEWRASDRGAYNSLGQVLSYRQTQERTYGAGLKETEARSWTQGRYDDMNRLSGYREDMALTVKEGDLTKTSHVSHLREDMAYYDEGGALPGALKSYTETILDDAKAEAAHRIQVSGIGYDYLGRQVTSQTAGADSDRVKAALRALAGLHQDEKVRPLAASRLSQILDATQGLVEKITDWVKENVASWSEASIQRVQNFLASFGSGAPGVLEQDAVTQDLLKAVQDHLPGRTEPLPAGVAPAARSLGVFDGALTLTRRGETVYDSLGRAAAWTEVTLSAASEVPAVSQVKLTFRGDSQRVDTYAARTQEGDTVRHVFRDGFVYNRLGQAQGYREASFEGETLSLPGRAWESLSAGDQQTLLNDVYANRREVEGLVAFTRFENAELDARGNMVDAHGTLVKRGYILNDFPASGVPDMTLTEAKSNAAALVENEIDQEIASAEMPLTAALTEQEKAVQSEEMAQALLTELLGVFSQSTAQRILSEENISRAEAQLKKHESDIDTFRGTYLWIKKSDQGQSQTVTDEKGKTRYLIKREYHALRAGADGNILLEGGYEFTEDHSEIVNGKVKQTEKKTLEATNSLLIANLSDSGERIEQVFSQPSLTGLFRKIGLRFNLGNEYYYSAFAATKNFVDLFKQRDGARAVLAQETPRLAGWREVEVKNEGQARDAAQALALAKDYVLKTELGVADSKLAFAETKERLLGMRGAKVQEAQDEVNQTYLDLAARFASELFALDGGTSFYLTDDQAMGLMDGGVVDVAGEKMGIDQFLRSAKIKTSQNSEEKFMNLSMDNPALSTNVNWRGDLEWNGNPFPGQDAASFKSILAAGPDLSALSLASDGHIAVSRTQSRALNEDGQMTSQSMRVHEITRQGAEVHRRSYTQETAHVRYNSQGRLASFERRTTETLESGGTRVTVENQREAAYNGKGRLVSSVTDVSETGPGFSAQYTLSNRHLSYDAAGRVVSGLQAKQQGDHLTVTRMLDNRYDAEGRLVFSASQTHELGAESWNDQTLLMASALPVEMTWNESFNVRGQVLRFTRLSSNAPTTGPPLSLTSAKSFLLPSVGEGPAKPGMRGASAFSAASYSKWETGRNVYDAAGRLSSSHTDVREWGRALANGQWSTILKSYSVETEISSYNAFGQALRQKTTTTENGRAEIKESTADNRYDSLGRLIETRTRTTSSDGRAMEVAWTARRFDGAGRAVAYQTVTRQDDALATETVFQARYDAQGRLASSLAHAIKENPLGETEEYDQLTRRTYNLFGQVAVSDQTMTRNMPEGGTLRTQEQTTFTYDAAGRAVSIATQGLEETDFNGDVRAKTYSSLREIMAFDASDRALRVRHTSAGQGQPTQVKTSLEDIQYDARGRVTGSSDLVRELGLDEQGHVLDQSYTQTLSRVVFDNAGRQTAYRLTTVDGLLKAQQDVSGISYDGWGRVTAMTTGRQETSLDPTTPLARGTLTLQTDMVYDAWGNLKDFNKTVTDGQLVTTHKLAKLLYNSLGQVTESLIHVTDTAGRDDFEYSFGLSYNRLGQNQGGAQISFKTAGGFVPSAQSLQALHTIISRGAGPGSLGSLGFRQITGQLLRGAAYDSAGRLSESNGARLSMAWNDDGDLIEDKPSSIMLRNMAFDSLGRMILQRVITDDGANRQSQWVQPVYDNQGRTVGQFMAVEISGLNGDGTHSHRSYFQNQSYALDALGRVARETTLTYGDSAAPAKVTQTARDEISYNRLGERTAWTETTSATDAPGRVSAIKTANAVYDNAGRLAGSDQNVFENGRLLYSDSGAANAYDLRGRLTGTQAARSWSDYGGGAIQGLDDGWSSGSAQVNTSYEYNGAAGSISGLLVSATGSGSHSDGAVAAQGIHLTYSQSNILYNGAGQVIGYNQSTVQVERYTRSETKRKGLRKKTRTFDVVGMNATDSTVTGILHDDFGRQIFSHQTSYNHGARASTTAWSKITSFDDQGRAKTLETWSETKINAGKGVTLTSGSHIKETRAYTTTSKLDESLTQKNTLSQWQSASDRSSFGRAMKVTDQLVKAVQVVGTVLSFTPAAPIGQMMVIGSQLYNTARAGISTHDLGLRGHRDREGAKQRAFNFYSFAATMGMSKFMPKMSNPVANGFANTVAQVAVAQASGADAGTTFQAGGMAFAQGYLAGIPYKQTGNDMGWKDIKWSAALTATIGEAAIQFGGSHGSQGERNAWILAGSALKGGAFGSIDSKSSILAGTLRSGGERIFLNTIEQNQGADPDGENARFRRMVLMSRVTGLASAVAGYAVEKTVSYVKEKYAGPRMASAYLNVLDGWEKVKSRVGENLSPSQIGSLVDNVAMDKERQKEVERQFRLETINLEIAKGRENLKTNQNRLDALDTGAKQLKNDASAMGVLLTDLGVDPNVAKGVVHMLREFKGKSDLEKDQAKLERLQRDLKQSLARGDVPKSEELLKSFTLQQSLYEKKLKTVETHLKERQTSSQSILKSLATSFRNPLKAQSSKVQALEIIRGMLQQRMITPDLYKQLKVSLIRGMNGAEFNRAKYVLREDWKDIKLAGSAMSHGALKGDFIENPDGWNVLGQVGAGMTPGGWAADTRDTSAGFKKMWKTNLSDGKSQTLLAVIGFVPILGDYAKIMVKSGKATKYAGKTAAVTKKFLGREGTLTQTSKKLDTELLQHGNEIANVLPKNRLFARVVSATHAKKFLNGEWKLTDPDRLEAFITALDDVIDSRMPKELAKRLWLQKRPNSSVLRKNADTIIVFRKKSAADINFNPEGDPAWGFIRGGRSRGNAREWGHPNGTIKELQNKLEIHQVYQVDSKGVKYEWGLAANSDGTYTVKNISVSKPSEKNSNFIRSSKKVSAGVRTRLPVEISGSVSSSAVPGVGNSGAGMRKGMATRNTPSTAKSPIPKQSASSPTPSSIDAKGATSALIDSPGKGKVLVAGAGAVALMAVLGADVGSDGKMPNQTAVIPVRSNAIYTLMTQNQNVDIRLASDHPGEEAASPKTWTTTLFSSSWETTKTAVGSVVDKKKVLGTAIKNVVSETYGTVKVAVSNAAEKTVQTVIAGKNVVVSTTNLAIEWTATTMRETKNKVLDGVVDAGHTIRIVERNYEASSVRLMSDLMSASDVSMMKRIGLGSMVSNLSLDVFDRQDSFKYDSKLPILFVYGVSTGDDRAAKLVERLKEKYEVDHVAQVKNGSHLFGLLDFVQATGHELGAFDVTALRARDGMRQAIVDYGRVFVIGHSQGTAISYAGFQLLTLAERARVVFVGNGSQRYVDKDKAGLAWSENVRTSKDKVAMLNTGLKAVGLRPAEQAWRTLPATPSMEWLGHDMMHYIPRLPNLRRIDDQHPNWRKVPNHD